LKDRIIQGAIAGIVGWLPIFVFNMIVYFGFRLTKLRFMDFGGVLAFNHQPRGMIESIIAEFIVLLFMLWLGTIFAMLIKVIDNPHLRLKGGIYGGACWITIYVTVNLFKVKGIYGITDFSTAFFNFAASIMWGTILGITYLFLNCNDRTKNQAK
jgi:hypothetical protein